MGYRINSDYDDNYFAYAEGVVDLYQIRQMLNKAFIEDMEDGEYGIKLRPDTILFNNVSMIIHTDIESDIRNIVKKTMHEHLYSEFEDYVAFEIKNDICYFLDILVKSGDITSFSVNVEKSNLNKNEMCVIVEFNVKDESTRCVYSDVFPCNTFKD